MFLDLTANPDSRRLNGSFFSDCGGQPEVGRIMSRIRLATYIGSSNVIGDADLNWLVTDKPEIIIRPKLRLERGDSRHHEREK